jgi:hypothetical protein
MRLNDKTYPAYYTCQNNKFELLQIDRHFETMLKDVQSYLEFVKSIEYTYKQVNKKYYLSETFKDSIRMAIPKILKDENYFEHIPSDCGLIFTEKGFNIYLVNPDDKQLRLLVYGFTRDVLTTFGKIDKDGNMFGMACSLDENGNPINDTKVASQWLESTLLALYFIHNCEIEQNIVKPNMKHRESGNKHYNESNGDIIFLDCKWFTDIIREAPFRVKGHLRWQFFGEKKTKRKLIWIDEFEKSGYKRSAMKTTEMLKN